MSRPSIAIGALGGTIASTASSAAGEVVPTVSAASLVAAVPTLADGADVRAETLAMLPSPHLDEPTVLHALAWARAAVDAGADGVVITQGTDTLEESAHLLDLFWDRAAPLVVTGAMRSPDAPGADGPANLLTAVRCAAEAASAGRGVLVAFDDEIHEARWVAKTDSISTGAFRSPVFGPIGRYVEGEVLFGVAPRRVAPLAGLPAPDSDPRVPLVTTYLGDDGHVLRALQAAGTDGVVVAGFGAGHVSPAMAEAMGDLAATVPVVFASRTGSGPTGRAMYGYPGSEIDLVARGALAAGWLAPVKARLLLWALAATGATRDEVAASFAERGRP